VTSWKRIRPGDALSFAEIGLIAATGNNREIRSRHCASVWNRFVMRRLSLFVLMCLLVAAGAAAPLTPAARTEIDGLMSRLETSGCTFNRNGTWYTAVEAKSHLLRKLKYLEDIGAVQTTEQFIALAASSSSATGQPYLVKCASDAPVQSRAWLGGQLEALRSGGRTPSAP
jgi:Family of unknown function (DUF5329)